MKGRRLTFVFLILIWCLQTGFAQQTEFDKRVEVYVKQFSAIAVQEMKLYHIPASVTLAQGIFETNAGISDLAVKANNHFGIKCHKDWTGDTFIQDDETKNECFRKYKSAAESYRDHSLFLTTRDRYKPLFSIPLTDYKGWANGLKTAGYATNQQYPEKLIGYIEKYHLDRFDLDDNVVASAEPAVSKEDQNFSPHISYEVFATGPGKRTVYLNNGLQFVFLSKNDDLNSIAKAFHVSGSKILKWNDLKKGGRLVSGQMVYLEPKKRKGVGAVHYVKEGETMFTVAQREGIRLKYLYRRNHVKQGQKLTAGQVLLLR
jgi:hypothetical protein